MVRQSLLLSKILVTLNVKMLVNDLDLKPEVRGEPEVGTTAVIAHLKGRVKCNILVFVSCLYLYSFPRYHP